MTLRGRQNAGCFPIGLAKMAIGGTGNQPIGLVHVLHSREQTEEAFRGVTSRGFGAPENCDNDLEDGAGDQCLRLLVPMGITGHARFVEHQGVGECAGIFRDIQAIWVEHVEGIEGC
ncbi:hypothetical protein BLJAPNOD_05680 [Ensifer sp. M14]|nr:hypothetical protein BLJAPNOD_05680 [Ensifer sp. M14]